MTRKFEEASPVATAQHITNTVFIDRALICVPIPDGKIPDEDTALKTGGPAWPGQRQLPPNVLNQIQTVGDQQVVLTIDPTLAALGLPAYPSLPANTEASKIEEIRRTIYVGNIPKTAEPEETMQFFSDMIGEVMYLKMAGSEKLSARYAFIEFSNQHTVPTALQNDGIEFKGNRLTIQHSRVAIIKPQAKTQDMAKREIQEALKKQQTVGLGMPGSLTTSALNRGLMVEAGNKDLARKVSSRSRSKSPGFWSSKYSRRSKSRSPDRRRSRSRDRYGSRSRYGSSRRDRSRDIRNRSKDRKERSKSKERRRRSKSKDKEKEKESSRKRRSPSPSESKPTRRDRDKEKQRDKDEKRKSDRDREKEKEKRRDDKKRSEKNSDSSKYRDKEGAKKEEKEEAKKIKEEAVDEEETEEEKRKKEEELREVDEILEEALGRKEPKQETVDPGYDGEKPTESPKGTIH